MRIGDRMRRVLMLSAAASLAVASAPAVSAADRGWPEKPIRIIVPGGVGGVTDIRARWLAERLAPALRVPVIVDNKPGAGGNIGTELAARSAPDGYTLVIVHQGTMAMNPHLYARTGYDPLADFVPVTRLGVGPLVLVVHPAVPAQTVGELVAVAKSRPGQLTFGSPGVGTPPYIAGELFKHKAGIDITHVPYRGGGQETNDLVAGHINMSIEGTHVLLPFIRAGRLRALAVTGAQRSPILPEVPTMIEAGVSGYDYQGWVGIAAPAGTPAPIVDRLYREIAAITATPDAREWFAASGLEPGGESPQVFGAIIRREYVEWGAIIRASGIKAE